MTFKINIDETGRDFFYNPAGNDDFDGRGLETAVSSPQKATDLVNTLIPVPGPSDPASMNASVTGTYSEGVTIPQYTTCNSASASILTFDPVNVTCMGRQTVVWGSLLNFAANGTCVLIDGRTRIATEVNALVPVGTGGKGFDIKGACDSIFVQVRIGEIQGIEAVLFYHTASSSVPVSYEVEVAQFFNIDQTLIEFHPPNASDQANFVIGSIQRDVASTTTGSTALHAMSGRLIVQAQVIDADMLATVEGGAEFSLDCQVGIGDIFVDVGSNAILNIGLMLGDLTINGTAHGVINQYLGTITINGTFNGIINGVRYGNWQNRREMETLLSADSFVNQLPVSLDVPIQLTFGAAQLGGVVEIDALGNVEVMEAGQYEFSFTFQYGRAGSGGVAWLFFQLLVDGVQVGTSPFVKLENINADFPAEFNNTFDLTANQVVTVELVRDSRGMNEGGVLTETPLVGWAGSPSAAVSVKRSKLE